MGRECGLSPAPAVLAAPARSWPDRRSCSSDLSVSCLCPQLPSTHAGLAARLATHYSIDRTLSRTAASPPSLVFAAHLRHKTNVNLYFSFKNTVDIDTQLHFWVHNYCYIWHERGIISLFKQISPPGTISYATNTSPARKTPARLRRPSTGSAGH